jgi:hypothetical protein
MIPSNAALASLKFFKKLKRLTAKTSEGCSHGPGRRQS